MSKKNFSIVLLLESYTDQYYTCAWENFVFASADLASLPKGGEERYTRTQTTEHHEEKDGIEITRKVTRTTVTVKKTVVCMYHESYY